MAKASIEIIQALRETAHKLKETSSYQWGHMGACNCGFLAQVVTSFTKDEIHRRAMERHGDWNEQLNDYCPSTGLPMDDLINAMLDFGFDADDLKHLERLSSPYILRSLPSDERYLKQNVRADVILYLETWADLLTAQMVSSDEALHQDLYKAMQVKEVEKECSLLQRFPD